MCRLIDFVSGRFSFIKEKPVLDEISCLHTGCERGLTEKALAYPRGRNLFGGFFIRGGVKDTSFELGGGLAKVSSASQNAPSAKERHKAEVFPAFIFLSSSQRLPFLLRTINF